MSRRSRTTKLRTRKRLRHRHDSDEDELKDLDRISLEIQKINKARQDICKLRSDIKVLEKI